MANRNFASGGKIYSMHAGPVLIDCNFIVDSTNANGLGISSLRGPTVHAVYMHTSATPAIGNPNPIGPGSGPPVPGGPVLGAAGPFAVLGASTVTNTGPSVITGDLGLYAGTSVTGFPPGIVTGVQHITDATAQAAQTAATATYNDLASRTSTGTISANLAGQTLTPGVYTAATSMDLSVGGTLTLDAAGDPNALWIFQAGSTVTLNNGSTVVIINGGSAANVYWQVGSSATIGTTAVALGTFIALASVTLQTGASLSGRAIARTAAVNLDTNAITVPVAPIVSAGGGAIVVQLEDNYNRFLSEYHGIVSPVSGVALKIDDSALTAGVAYTITTLGNATAAKWRALGLPPGVTPAVGVSFTALSNGGAGNTLTSRVMTSALIGSNVCSIEMIGDPNKSIAPDPTKNQGFGAQFILQCRDYTGAAAIPTDGSLISLSFLLNNSSVIAPGE